MKKFGTPMGAAPGSANEKVGLAGVGTPLLVTGGGGVGAFFLFGFFGFFGLFGFFGFGFGAVGFVGVGFVIVVVGVVDEAPRFAFGWPEPRFAPGVVEVGFDEDGLFVIVVVGVGDEPPWFGFGLGDVEVEVEVEVVCGSVVVAVAAGVVAVTGGHDWETLVMGRLTGSGSELGGVPGATFWNVNVLPPATVMITMQPAADAVGKAARPSPVSVTATLTAAILSIRPFNTVACSSRGWPLAKSQLR